jgi:four helix bundle protein
LQSYRDLFVWQKAMDLVIAIYRVTATFPKTEMYALANQMQRSAVSIPSNIAEGYGLKQTKAYLRHLALASGSLCELETQLEISDRLSYLPVDGKDLIMQANEVGRMLSGLQIA